MKKIQFTRDQLNEMVRLHDSGMLNKDIAKRFSTSAGTVNRRLAELGVQSRHPKLTLEREAEAIALYEKYQNLSQVCTELSMNTETLSMILKKNNIRQLSMSELKRTKKINESYFDKIDSHRKAYYLGLLYADGTVSSKSNRVQISLQDIDGDILYAFRDDLESDYKIITIKYHDKNPNWKNQLCFTISNTRIHDALIEQGVIPNKSLSLKFPTNLSEEFVSSFLLGYMDGDGSIAKKECRASLIGTEDFCNSVKNILKDKFGIHCSISKCHGKETSTRCLRISGRRQVKIFLDWIYSKCDVHLTRKYNIYQKLYCS